MIYRLKKNNEFITVYKRGRSFANDILVIYILKNRKNKDEKSKIYNRIGVSVSKKVGNSVVRSRCKRLISESFRLNYDTLKLGYDIVFIARKPLKDKGYFEVEKAMKNLFKKAGLHYNEEVSNKFDNNL